MRYAAVSMVAAVAISGTAQAVSPIVFSFHARASQFNIINAPQPAVGEAQADAALLLSRANRLRMPAPNKTAGAAPGTLEDIIIQADGAEQPYEQTYGTGVVVDQGSFPDETVFDFNADSLYPGAIVQGRAQFIDAGQLVPDPLPPSSGSLTINGATLKAGGQASAHLAVANAPAVVQAINTLVNQAFAPDQAPSWSCSFSSVASSQDASFSASASFGYSSMVSLSDTFSSANSKTSNHVLVKCTESFFTISYLPDTRSDAVGDAAFFDTSVTPALAAQYIAPGDPPLFVQSVSYGAELFLLADSSASTSQMQDSLKAAFSYAGATGSTAISDADKSTLATLDVHILAIGGRASAQQPIVSSLTGPGVISGLIQYLQQTLNIAANGTQSQEVGAPISYKLAYLDFTPVAETSTILGVAKQTTDAILSGANIQFQQNGNGKGKDTLVDISVEDASGRAIAYRHIGPNTQWANNYLTPVINLPIVAQGSEAALAGGNLHLIIHPAQHDVWKFTAYVHLNYNDGTSQFGQYNDELSSDSTVTIDAVDPAQANGISKVTHSGKETIKPLANFVH